MPVPPALLAPVSSPATVSGTATDAGTGMRVLIDQSPFAAHAATIGWGTHSQWPAEWISAGAQAGAAVFALRVTVERQRTVRIHVTAHEAYLLNLDGRPLGRGPERGSSERWCVDSWDLVLPPGEHLLTARVWWAGEHAPHSAMSEGLGFLLAVEGEDGAAWSTGRGPWTARPLDAFTFGADVLTFAAAPTVETDAAALDVELEDDREWPAAMRLGNGQIGQPPGCLRIPRLLVPATLPPQRLARYQGGEVRWVGPAPASTAERLSLANHRPQAAEGWRALLAAGIPCTVRAGTRIAALIDLGTYLCAYPELAVSGGAGATITVAWSEALTVEPATGWKAMEKGHRDLIDGKCFTFFGADALRCDGAARVMPAPYWRSGRYVLVTVETGDGPLTITGLGFQRTGYPLPREMELSGDARWEALVPWLVRTLRLCAHDSYMDCPYFERLQYVGDTRLEALVTYVLCRDDRLPRKAIGQFGASRIAEGLVQGRYPARHRQVIAPFALAWVGMVHDFATWRDDPEFVRSHLPGVRAVLDAHLARCGADGLLRGGEGWDFLDWTGWPMGIPPGAAEGNASFNWQLVGALEQAARLEEHFGDEDLARRWKRVSGNLAIAIDAAFWDEERGSYREERAGTCRTEHAQCLALLSGRLAAGRHERVAASLLGDAGLVRTTLFFTHYLFEAYAVIDRLDRLQERMAEWFGLSARGLHTTPEKPEPARSDCHAWSSHPLYHAFAGLLGIRPTGFGFRAVTVRPRLGGMPALRGRLPHPAGGWIEVEAAMGADGLHGSIALPDGLPGVLDAGRGELPLAPGRSRF